MTRNNTVEYIDHAEYQKKYVVFFEKLRTFYIEKIDTELSLCIQSKKEDKTPPAFTFGKSNIIPFSENYGDLIYGKQLDFKKTKNFLKTLSTVLLATLPETSADFFQEIGHSFETIQNCVKEYQCLQAWHDNNPYDFLKLKKSLQMAIESAKIKISEELKTNQGKEENYKTLLDEYRKISAALACCSNSTSASIRTDIHVQHALDIAQLTLHFVQLGGEMNFADARKTPLDPADLYSDFQRSVPEYNEAAIRKLLETPSYNVKHNGLFSRSESVDIVESPKSPNECDRTQSPSSNSHISPSASEFSLNNAI